MNISSVQCELLAFYEKARMFPEDWATNVGEESQKSWLDKWNSGFWTKYCHGKGLDIGFSGYLQNIHAILPDAIGIDLNYPGYDGYTLPFCANSQDFVYSSHFLEHIFNRQNAIQEQFRVVKPNGYIIIVVPHRDLYERKMTLPSRWNEDHKVFFTAASLLKEIEDSLPINSYRIRHLHENDEGHTYGVPVEIHANGQYEIEVIIQKLNNH